MGLSPEFLRLPLAHRALHDAHNARPENSPGAIRAAVAAGYGIECDVQPSSDGRAMVFHDYDLNRLTHATGPINSYSAEALGRVRFRDGPDGVPSLREVLALVAGRVPLLVEIKDQDGTLGPEVGALEAEVAADLAGYAGPVAVMSFNPHSMRAMAELAPGVARGIITSAYRAGDWQMLSAAARERLRAIPDYDAVGAAFISHEADDLARPRVAELKRAGAGVLCWTIRSPAAEAEARRFADNITFEGYLPAIPAG